MRLRERESERGSRGSRWNRARRVPMKKTRGVRARKRMVWLVGVGVGVVGVVARAGVAMRCVIGEGVWGEPRGRA